MTNLSWNRGKMRFPGIDSYSGRYAYFALAAGLGLIIIAYLGWNHVNRSSREQISQIEARAMMASVLSDTLTHLNLVENSLQRIVIEPDAEEIMTVERRFKRLASTLGHLERILAGQNGPSSEIAMELQKDVERLQQTSRGLIAIRSDVERWFPALRLMREEMFPHNQQMLGLLDRLLDESSEDLSVEDQLQVVKTVSALRHAWLNMISEVRLYVANRFGIFASEFRTGMEFRLTNVIYYAEEIPGYLDELEAMAESGQIGFTGAASLEEMNSHYHDWMAALSQLSEILDDPNWRMDLLLMRETVNPILDRIRQRLLSLDIDLNTQSARDITQLTAIARQLSESILGIAVVGIILICLVYLFLRRNLLRPIAETALALKQEAQGLVDIEPPPARLRETRDLVDAFAEMRRHVHSRQRSLDHMAHHDALTQLPNRVLFRDRLKHALEMASRSNYLVGLMFLDLDNFKKVNDSLGHLVGDELLKIVAERLQALVRTSDTVGRLGGDEFVILVEGLADQNDIIPLVEKALADLEEPIRIADHELCISTSIGIALAPYEETTAEHLIGDADSAMYEVKRQGGAAYHFFCGEMPHQVSEGLYLENEVRQGVEQKQFLFHFQPVVNLRDNGLKCCEALLRWQHPEKGLLSPGVFLDVLDSTGLILIIMDGLLEQASDYQKQISQQFGRPIAVSINLSVRLLNDPAFCRGVLERLMAGQFADNGLILEITEDILTQELAEADVFLQQAKALGGRIALDDFGTGQASLSHLRQFPFDLLKIDRAFIHRVVDDSSNASLVEAIIKLAHAFEMPVVAEGVETEAQRDFIKVLGCDYIQGHLVGVPMHANQQLETINASVIT
ncbi:MAG: EAL domain-containing protein [Pseudomonadota bacterium]